MWSNRSTPINMMWRELWKFKGIILELDKRNLPFALFPVCFPAHQNSPDKHAQVSCWLPQSTWTEYTRYKILCCEKKRDKWLCHVMKKSDLPANIIMKMYTTYRKSIWCRVRRVTKADNLSDKSLYCTRTFPAEDEEAQSRTLRWQTIGTIERTRPIVRETR